MAVRARTSPAGYLRRYSSIRISINSVFTEFVSVKIQDLKLANCPLSRFSPATGKETRGGVHHACTVAFGGGAEGEKSHH